MLQAASCWLLKADSRQLTADSQPMLLAIISDVHANLEALDAVTQAAEAAGAEAFVCLGDVVGYGPDPVACIDAVRARCANVVLGNHDLAVATGGGRAFLPADGRRAAAVHHGLLDEERRAWLESLPLRAEGWGATFVHASPDDPGGWHRLDSYPVLRAQFDAFDTPLCFVGHSHVPGVVGDRIGALQVRPGGRFLVNAGSVGQPRDGDPRAALVLYDAEAFTCEFVRVPYDTAATAAKIRDVGLPAGLGERLHHGR
jgi:diadenosine tetraphosphatase ApaH/serine/threonine PP2A family protein phosphatase